MSTHFNRGLATFAALLCLHACAPEPPTQIVVRVATDLRPGDELRGFRIRASRRDGALITDRTVDLRQGAVVMPAELGLLPEDPDDTRFVDVDVSTDLAVGSANFSQHAAVRFVRGNLVTLEMFLARSCEAPAVRTACEAQGQSCGAGGQCVAIERGVPPLLDAGVMRVDAGAPPDTRLADAPPAARDTGPMTSPDARRTPDVAPVDVVAPCVRATCASLERRCGTASDGCGAMLSCGACAAMQTCSPAGACVECVTGTMRACMTGLHGRCNAGQQRCEDARWAACTPTRAEECADE